MARSSATASSRGIFRRDDEAVFAAGQTVPECRKYWSRRRQGFGWRLQPAHWEAVTIAIGGNPAGKGKHIRAAIMLKHLLLGKGALPGDSVGDAELVRQVA